MYVILLYMHNLCIKCIMKKIISIIKEYFVSCVFVVNQTILSVSYCMVCAYGREGNPRALYMNPIFSDQFYRRYILGQL